MEITRAAAFQLVCLRNSAVITAASMLAAVITFIFSCLHADQLKQLQS